RSSCSQAPASNIGWMHEIDVAFWVPVVAFNGGAIESIAWFLPYVFVNNGWAMATGREIYGFPKELGSFVLPKDKDAAALFPLDTLAIKTLGHDSQAEVQGLLDVRRQDAPALGEAAEVWNDIRAAFETFMGLFLGPGGRVELPGLGLWLEVFRFLIE